MNQRRGLDRREALIAGGALCVAASAPPPARSQGSAVSGLVEKATRRRRALRDGAFPAVTRDIAGANLPLNGHEATLDAAAQSQAMAAEARRLGRQPMSEDDRDTLDCLIWDLERDAGLARFYWHEFPLGYSGSQLSTLSLQFAAPASPEDWPGFLRKVRQAPAYVEAIRERLNGQLQRGLTAPAAEGARAYDQLLVEAREVTANIQKAADAIAVQPGGGSLAREARKIADGALAEAFARLEAAVRMDYLPALGDQAKVTRAEGAADYFRELARLRVSEDLDPAETYGQARERLAAIDADLARMRRRLGVAADAAEFHRAMIGDPRWYVRGADELKSRLETAIAQVTPLAPRYFHALPKTPFGVAPLPDALQTRLLNGFYRPPNAASPRGVYFYNTSRLDISNWAWTKPMVSHELMPGHHLQMALLFESETLPPYRKSLYFPAYAEGWGEYARLLMEEAGFYADDPWGLYASRLLERRFVLRAAVEAGVHRPGWTWQAAETELATDPLTRPGTTRQIALSAATFRSTGLQYWWGMRRFVDLRGLAKSRAGAGFDVRDFHALVMRGDLVPFAVAERRIRDFPPWARAGRPAPGRGDS
jgi:uncharacterized protein (DUF885 family)